MEQEVTANPFMVINYDYSWQEIKELTEAIAKKYPNKYKLADDNDEEQTLIVLASFDFRVFEKDKTIVIYISKIDTCLFSSMLVYEARNYNGDICTSYDYNKAVHFIETFSEDLFQLH